MITFTSQEEEEVKSVLFKLMKLTFSLCLSHLLLLDAAVGE